jgi:hypothetical protein
MMVFAADDGGIAAMLSSVCCAFWICWCEALNFLLFFLPLLLLLLLLLVVLLMLDVGTVAEGADVLDTVVVSTELIVLCVLSLN